METELPMEVLIQVAEYLKPADLAKACCVNRTWFFPFASRLWRSVQKDQFSQERLLDALPQYSGFIRELHGSRFSRLDKLGPGCTRLTVFEGHISGPQQIAIGILERNPDLEDIALVFPNMYEASNQIMRLISVLVKMKKLKRLSINGFWAIDKALDYLLEMLPGLEELSIELYKVNPNAVPSSDFIIWWEKKLGKESKEQKENCLQDDAAMSALAAASHSSSRQLRNISLISYEISFKALLMILQSYPLLESIVLDGMEGLESFQPSESPSYLFFCQQLGVLCPRLNQLTLKDVDINSEGLECLLSAIPRLKCLVIYNTFLTDRDALRILLAHQNYIETLEVIDLTQGSMAPSAEETIEVLRMFHRLRKLRVTSGAVKAEALIQLFQDSTSSERQSQEQSTEPSSRPGQTLERLDVTIVGPSKKWAPSVNQYDSASEYEMDQSDDHDEERVYPLYNTLKTLLQEKTLLDVERLELE
ncbi:hypothetical protein FBU30_002578 [Linnemannia zychae]|nr:hypothetical protein FBU30_002578 [Linnemannia zychae]